MGYGFIVVLDKVRFRNGVCKTSKSRAADNSNFWMEDVWEALFQEINRFPGLIGHTLWLERVLSR